MLSSLVQIKALGMGANLIEDISAIYSLAYLEFIDVREDCITDFSPIEYLKENGNLKTIYGDSAEEQDYARCQ